MPQITKPIATDETLQRIAEALDAKDTTQERKNEIKTLSEEVKNEVIAVGEQVKNTIPEDYSKLSNKVNNMSNALKGSVSGENVVRIDDISPVEHKMDVRVQSKNLIFTPYNLAETTTNGVTFTTQNDGSVKIVGVAESPASVYIRTNIRVSSLVGQTLCIKGTGHDDIRLFGHLYFDDGTVTYNYYRTDVETQIARVLPEGADLITIVAEVKKGTYDTVIYPQLEVGTETEYTPFVDVSSATVLVQGKNLLDITGITGTSLSAYGGTLTCGADGGISGSGTPTDYIGFKQLKLYLPKGIYTISATGNYSNMTCTVSPCNADGSVIMGYGVATDYPYLILDLGIYSDYAYCVVEIKRLKNNVEMSGTAYFQIEKGSVATDYTPCVETMEHTVSVDGTVEGITSVSSITTLISDTNGVIIKAEYNLDINKAFASQQAKIAQLEAHILELTTK